MRVPVGRVVSVIRCAGRFDAYGLRGIFFSGSGFFPGGFYVSGGFVGMFDESSKLVCVFFYGIIHLLI